MNDAGAGGYSVFFWWLCGIFLLVTALLISARMGIYQEVLYRRHGKHAREALYVTVNIISLLISSFFLAKDDQIIEIHVSDLFPQHLLPLPGFLLLYTNIADHIAIANASQPVAVPLVGASMPILWILLIVDTLTHYLCISSVFVLTTECTSLTVTLVVTLRKFISLIFSIVYFQNPFTVYHWFGTALVFIGTAIFTELIPSLANKSTKPARTTTTTTVKQKSN